MLLLFFISFASSFKGDQVVALEFISVFPTTVEFSNSSGGKVECAASGDPQPVISWLFSDGSTVDNVPGLRHLTSDGTLNLPPFKSDDYRQDVHSIAYRCLASNSKGSIISHDIHVKGVVGQHFDLHVYDVYTLKGNAAVLKCLIPQVIGKFIKVTSWLKDLSIKLTYTTSNISRANKYIILPTGDLLVQNVTLADGMNSFRCLAVNQLTNETMTSISSGKIFVTDSIRSVPPKILITPLVSNVDEGTNFLLPCIASGKPTPTYTWSKNSSNSRFENIVESNRIKVLPNLLLIQNARSSDSGTYTCTASNGIGSDRLILHVIIKEPLKTVIIPVNSIVSFGKSVQLVCKVTGYPVKNVYWMKNGRPLSLGVYQPNNNTIRITNMSSLYAGYYQCFASNEFQSSFGISFLQLEDSLPIILKGFNEKLLRPGDDIRVECKGRGHPVPDIEWTVDNIEISDNNRYEQKVTRTNSGEITSELILKNIKNEDGGVYRCSLKNNHGKVSHHARINVFGKLGIRSGVKISAIAEENAQIDCPFHGYPVKTVIWQKNETTLPDNRRQIPVKNGTLFIKRIHRGADSGYYKCIVESPDGYHTSGLVDVNVIAKPRIIPFAFRENIIAGNTVRASCIVDQGDLPIFFQWMKDGKDIAGIPEISTKNINHYSSLLNMDKVNATHSGNYTCVARNVAATVSYSTPLIVHVPLQWLVIPNDVTGSIGERRIIHCKAKGFPKPTIIWEKPDEENIFDDFLNQLKSNENIHIFSNGSLLLKNITKLDEGVYYCIAKNDIGVSLSKAITVKVNAAPVFPIKFQDLSVKRGENVTIICKAFGDSPIKYKWSVDNNSVDFLLNSRRYKIINDVEKENREIYSKLSIEWVDKKDSLTYTCSAENDIGTDEFFTRLIVQHSPDAPELEKSITVINQSVHLSWVSPFDGNSPIMRYIIQYKKENESWTDHASSVTVESDKISTRIYNLDPATVYNFRIMAENAIGNGSFSKTVIAITDEYAPTAHPQNVQVETTDNTSVRIMWNPPEKNHWNGVIRGYNIGYKINNVLGEYKFNQLEVPEGYSQALIYQLSNLRMFTQYKIVVQAYNSKGTGPFSKPVIAWTSEGVPTEPPTKVGCAPLTSRSIHVVWEAPREESLNGILRGYKILYKPSSEWYDALLQTKITSTQSSKVSLHELEINTNYSIQVLAFTKVGDGMRSTAVFCKTLEDVPEPPVAVKVLPSSSDSVIVSWKQSKKGNAEVNQFNVYYKQLDDGQTKSELFFREASFKKSFIETEYMEVTGLRKNKKYEFWVTASSTVGEGPPSSIVAQTVADSIVPAKIASFDDVIKTAWKHDIIMPCKAVGVPKPKIKWMIGNERLLENLRLNVHKEGALMIAKTSREDTGNYTCVAYNAYGRDEVTYSLLVQLPPSAPKIDVISTTESTIQIQWNQGYDGGDPIKGYILHYMWERKSRTSEIRPELSIYTLKNLACGTTYQLYMEAFNSIGIGEPSEDITVSTTGTEIEAPSKEILIRESSTFVTLDLDSWPTSGCPIEFFGVEYMAVSSKEWTVVGSNILPNQKKVIISELTPATQYLLRFIAQTSAGASMYEYKFSTSTFIGEIIPTEIYENDQTVYIFHMDPRIFIPCIVLLILVIIPSVVVFVVMKCRNGSDGSPSEMDSSLATSQMNTWVRNSRTFSLEYGYTQRDSTLSRKSFKDPCPYATSRMIDCYPEGFAGPSSNPQFFIPGNSQTWRPKKHVPHFRAGLRNDNLYKSEPDFLRTFQLNDANKIFPPGFEKHSTFIHNISTGERPDDDYDPPPRGYKEAILNDED